MKLPYLLAVLLFSAFATIAAPPPEVELLIESERWQPTSTVEVRFSRPMVAQEQVGAPKAESPLVITPALPGSFTWLSTRSGVYTPSTPPALGTSYKVALRRGLADAAGAPIAAEFSKTVQTPPFQVSSGLSDKEHAEETPALPELRIAFNLNVKLEGAEKCFEFVSDDGKKIAANVRFATRRDYFSIPADAEDWNERWLLANRPAAAVEKTSDDESEEATPRPNRLIVQPVTPLTPGPLWNLEMKPGITASAGGFKIAAGQMIPLGKVKPFTLKTLEAANYLNSGRSLELHFSEGLAPDVKEETAGKFFRVIPAPPKMRFEQGYETLSILGDFERGQEYRLEIDPSLLGESGLSLSGERSRTFRFEPVKPRLYLPKITAEQLLGGERKFPVRGVNLHSVKITTRLVAPENASRALEAFKKYEKEQTGEEEDSREPYQAIPAGAIKGTPLTERVIPLPAGALDARQEAILDWTEILGGKKAGLIFVTVEGQPLAEAKGGPARPAAQALIQLTDLGVLWKKTGNQLQTTVFSLATGQPMNGVSVTLVRKDFVALASGLTNAEGAVTLPVKADLAWLLVRKGDDGHTLPLGEDAQELPMSRFNLPIYYAGWEPQESTPPELRGLLFTDRPLYRPGETVQVKGLVRRVENGGVKRFAPKGGVLTLSYPRDGEEEMEVKIDARGAFDAKFELPGTKVGEFSLRLSFPAGKDGRSRETFYTSFQVQDFQPNAFETRLAMPERFTPEQKVAAEVSASYLFGAPITEARVQWTLQYAPETFNPKGFGDFFFGEDAEPEQKSLTLRGEGKLAPQLAITPQLPKVGSGGFRGLLTVEVTDQNQQTVTEAREFSRDPAAFFLGLAQSSFRMLGHEEELVASAVAVRPDGTPMPAPVAIKAELVRIDHDTVRVQAAGKAVSFQTEDRETVVAQAEGKTLVPYRDGEAWKVRDGETVRFKPGKAGQYRLRLTAKDAAGNETRTSSSFYVSGSEAIAWDYRNPAQIDLIADKAEYRAGETARILVKTPISGEAWITVERGESILRSQRVKLEGNAPTIEIPISVGDTPNVFVSVVLVRGAEQSTRKFKTPDFRYGVCRLNVSNPLARLQVAVSPGRTDFQPGEEIDTEVRVLDAKGGPVADAEVTFFAVDDGILTLTGYERPQPNGIFEQPVPLRIRTGLTLFDLLPEDPSDLTFTNKGYLIGGGGMEGPGLKLRHDFPGTACWLPALRTDREGRVKARFTAPDALTRYRLVAVAHAGDDRFGSGESSVGIRQPLMLLSALGSVGKVGDEIIARAVVRNETGGPGTAEVSLQLDSTAQPVKGALTAQILLAKGEARSVDFPVKLVRMGQADWKWSASIAVDGVTYDDRLAATLNVGSPVPILRETYLTELDAASNDLLAGVNPQVLEGEGAVAVTLANTRLASLGESANQLLEYPYGCAEQLVSGVIPWIVVNQLGPVLGDFGKDPEAVQRTIETAREKIFALQTPAGGLAYWPGGQRPNLFPSAWAAIAFAELEKEQADAPEDWKKLLDYLSSELRDLDKIRDTDALDQRALVLYALATAGKPEPAYYEKLATRRNELTREGRALLALAVLESKGAPAFAEGLLNPDLPAPEGTSWFGSATRERAVSLLAWTRLRPKDKEVGRLTKELLASRANGHWRTTQENAWALLALSRYFTLVEKEVKPVSGTLVQKGRTTPFQLTKKQFTETTRVDFDPAKALGTLSVANPKKLPLYGETRFVVRPPVAEQPRQDRGYAVSRSYQKVAADGSLKDAADLQVGDRVVVTLRVATPRPGHFVAIDDPLPAILEAVNPEFRAQQAGVGVADFWQADYREVRADRVLYFCDHLPAGAYTFSYLARVRTAGSVTAPATKVEEMYGPERFGLSETARLTSQPAK